MNYKQILAPLAVSAVILLAACSKDQKVVKELDGEWTVSSMTTDGVAEDASVYANTVYKFDKCKVKKEACPGTISDYDSSKGNFSMDFTYKIYEDGAKMDMNVDLFGVVTTSTNDILEHSKSTFKFSNVSSGVETITTLSKK